MLSESLLKTKSQNQKWKKKFKNLTKGVNPLVFSFFCSLEQYENSTSKKQSGWVELTDEHPLLDLRGVLKIPIFTFSALVSFVLVVEMFGGMLVLPLFLQNLGGLGAGLSSAAL